MKFVVVAALLLCSVVTFAGQKPPRGGWIIKQHWSQLSFTHWEVDANQLRRLIPRPLELDTYEGRAYVGVVTLEMTKGFAPFVPITLYSPFNQVNLRTYVKYKGKRGVYFFSLDADHFLTVQVSNPFFKLPYRSAKTKFTRHGNQNYSFSSHRKGKSRFNISFGPTSGYLNLERGGFYLWLTDLMRYYQVDSKGCVHTAEMWHAPFDLQESWANVKASSLLNDLPLTYNKRDYHTLYSWGTIAYFWPKRTLGCR